MLSTANPAKPAYEADLDDIPRGRFLRQMLFANWRNWLPSSGDNDPAKYGQDWPRRIRNLYIENKADGVQLGAWQFLPEELVDEKTTPTTAVFEQALNDPKYPTILYLHGRNAVRFQMQRAQFGWAASKRNMNFVSIDWRGSVDSSRRHPTERGVVRDARAAFDWIVSMGALPGNIVIAGHSLGSGIATALAGQLCLEGFIPRALITIAAYTSIEGLLLTVRVGGKLGIRPLKILSWIRPLHDHLLRNLNTRFDTEKTIMDVKCPIAMIHAKDDYEISSNYSCQLFHTLLWQEGSDAVSRPAFSILPAGTLGRLVRRHIESTSPSGEVASPMVLWHANTGGHGEVESAATSLDVMEDVIRNGWQS